MLSGISLIVAFVLMIVILILMISKFKIHPFLSLLAVSFVFALIAGIPFQDVKEGDKLVRSGLDNVITSGFASTFQGIGLVIIFGALIGSVLEVSGAALKISDTVVRLLGPKHPDLALLIMGWIVSIPVFCDSGYVILNPIRKGLRARTKHSAASLAVCLSAGLYAAHVFIPPTPGPIAAADILGVGEDLLMLMGLGVVASIPALVLAYIYSRYLAKMKTKEDYEENIASYEEVQKSYGRLPSAFLSFAPIVLPVILMAVGSIASVLKLQGTVRLALSFLGKPIIALAIGLIISLFLLPYTKDKTFREIVEDTLKTCGPILFITAAGGILGKVISESGMISYIKDNAVGLASFGIFFPFLLSAILKTAQGSSTVALVTTAGLMAPMMETLGLASPILRVLTVLAIGAGAMTVSHANDSYFWVVTNFSGFKTEEGYKTQTVVTLLEGLGSIVIIALLWLVLK